MKEKNARVRELEFRISELRARLPKHSPPPAMMIELDDLEYELEILLKEQENGESQQNERSPD